MPVPTIINLTRNTIMNNEKPQNNRLPWTTPELTILSISLDTEQGEPLDPPDAGPQS